MKYHKIILGLLALLIVTMLCLCLCLSTINCTDKKISTQQSMSHIAAAYKYDFIIIENTRLRGDEEFKAFVEKQVKDTSYIDIRYDTVVRLHKTYLIRAWVFYKKEKN